MVTKVKHVTCTLQPIGIAPLMRTLNCEYMSCTVCCGVIQKGRREAYWNIAIQPPWLRSTKLGRALAIIVHHEWATMFGEFINRNCMHLSITVHVYKN
eukprot:4844784-Amphidinium_carterae.1